MEESLRWKEIVRSAVIFLGCIVGFSYQTYVFLQHYLKYPTIVNVEESNPFEVLLPAITLCSRNRFSRMKFCNKRNTSCTFHKDTITFCDEYPRYCFSVPNLEGRFRNYTREEMGVPKRDEYHQVTGSRSWFEATEFFPKIRINCEMSYGSRDAETCKIGYLPFTNADNSPNYCFNFASAVDNPNFKEQIYANSLKITFTIGTHPEDYFFPFGPVGMHAVVHSRMQLANPFVEGFTLEAGKQYNADVSLTEIKRMKPPYSTNCHDYISSWKANNGTGPLTQSECVEYCKLASVISLNKCVSADILYAHLEERLCENGETTTDEIIKNCTKKCQPACEEKKYEVEYREKHGSKEEFDSSKCVVYEKKWVKEQLKIPYASGSVEHCRLSQTAVTFSFRKFQFRHQIYSQQYQTVEVFSYIGGYLGLWLGLGLISVFESLGDIAYHVWRTRRFKHSSVQNLHYFK